MTSEKEQETQSTRENVLALASTPAPPPKEIEKNKKLGLRNVAILLELLGEALGRIGQVFQGGKVHYVLKGIIIPPTSLE